MDSDQLCAILQDVVYDSDCLVIRILPEALRSALTVLLLPKCHVFLVGHRSMLIKRLVASTDSGCCFSSSSTPTRGWHGKSIVHCCLPRTSMSIGRLTGSRQSAERLQVSCPLPTYPLQPKDALGPVVHSFGIGRVPLGY
jgi:hypothetical protein